MGTAHPTGYPTYVLLGLAGEPGARAVRRAGLPDEPVRGALPSAVAAAVTVDLVRALTRSTPLGVAAGLGLALTPVVWAHRDARRGPRPAPRPRSPSCCACWSRWEDAPRPAPASRRTTGADRWLVAAAVVFGLAVGNHSLTLLLAPAVGAVRAGRRARDPAPAAPHRRPALGALVGDGRPRLPRAAAAGRAVPRRARVRPPRDVGRVLVHRPGPAVPGQPRRPVRRPGRPRSASLVDLAPRPVRAPRGAHPGRRWSRPVIARPRYALLTGHALVITLLLRRVVRERRDRALLPRAGR